jgi:hypothetical protein
MSETQAPGLFELFFSRKSYKMVVGMIFRLGIDLTMVSVFMASMKKSNGVELNTSAIGIEPVKMGVDQFLNLGEIILEQAVLHSKNYPQFFKSSK